MTLTYQNGFARPPDVPAYVPVPVTYAANGTDPHIVGDGTGTRGSPMPVLASQLADIPSTATGWLVSGSAPPEGSEAKFRFHMNKSHIAPDDPIRNYGAPGSSHLHQFFGNTSTNAFSTFASLRNRANQMAAQGRAASTSAGGPYNGSGYWIPAMMDSDGTVVPPGMIAGYYTLNPKALATKAQRLPRGLRYVFGCNMEDPDDDIIKARIAAANALPGNSGRYTYIGNGFFGWIMYDPTQTTIIQTTLGQDYSPCLKNLNGSDPWGGAGYAGCWIKGVLHAPGACDGTNLWSPGGLDHMYQPIQDSFLGVEAFPQGSYLLPQLQILPYYRMVTGTSHLNWRLSSDDHVAMVLGRSVANGTSMHGDWFGAWDDSVFGASTGWQMQCCAVADGLTAFECDSGCFSQAGTRILGSITGDNAPDGSRTPQINFFEIVPNYTVPAFSGTVTVAAHPA